MRQASATIALLAVTTLMCGAPALPAEAGGGGQQAVPRGLPPDESLVLPAAMAGQEGRLSYGELSRTMGLDAADALMRKGQYLEAAVAYRNSLLKPGDREAVRVPLALALIANGDLDYAGLELIRAEKLYDGFTRLRVGPDALFPSSTTLIERLAEVDTTNLAADGLAAMAYAWLTLGRTSSAQTVLALYARQRGEDTYVEAMTGMMGVRKKAPVRKPAESIVGNEEISKLERRVGQMPSGRRDNKTNVRGGKPQSADLLEIRKSMVIKGELFEE